MKSVIVSAVAALGLGVAFPAMAQEVEAPPTGPIQIIRAGDTAMTCAAVADEAAQLSEAMGGEPDGGLFGRLGGVARAGASMMIPGAGLVIAGADAVTAPGRERKEAEAAAIREAVEAGEQRNPGLVLAGNAYRGVSVNDCVVSAHRAVNLFR